MDFTAEHYFRASVERMNQAQFLYREGRGYYALAMYAAGLAVECLLRAYMVKRKREFEARHDLLLLFKESGILNVDPQDWRAKGRGLHPVEKQLSVCLRSAAPRSPQKDEAVPEGEG